MRFTNTKSNFDKTIYDLILYRKAINLLTMKSDLVLFYFFLICYELICYSFYILFTVFSTAFLGNEMTVLPVDNLNVLNLCKQYIKIISRVYITKNLIEYLLLLGKECICVKKIGIRITIPNVFIFTCYFEKFLPILLLSLALFIFLKIDFKMGVCHQNVLLDAG